VSTNASRTTDDAAGNAVVYAAADLVTMASCRDAVSVAPMAHRWVRRESDRLDPAAWLEAPHYARVPPLRIDTPLAGTACDVYLTGLAVEKAFNHLRVTWPGAEYVTTVTPPGRYRLPDKAPGPWRVYACTLPSGTPWVEISKSEEVAAGLAAVEFVPRPSVPCAVAPADDGPMILGITDMGVIAGELLQAYDWRLVEEFFKQMRGAGFTHCVQQVYGGGTSWSEVAKLHGEIVYGHLPHGNTNEPAARSCSHGHATTETLQQDIDMIRDCGMSPIAGFRINNEWLADWCKEYWGDDPAVASQFSVDHPEFWSTYKSGDRTGGGLDFAFPEVRQHRLDVIREWCDKVERFDGVCIDVYRHPPMVTYPEHLVQAFKEQTGIDVRTVEPIDENTLLPEWLQFRSAPFTEFMRMVRAELRSRYGDRVALYARVANGFDRALLDGVDLPAWFEQKLVDVLILQHRPPANPLDADSRPIIDAAHAAGIQVVHLFGGGVSCGFADADLASLRPHMNNWRDWGSDGIGFYEAGRVVADGRWLRELPGIAAGWGRG